MPRLHHRPPKYSLHKGTKQATVSFRGNRPGTNRVEAPKRSPQHRYTTDSYRRAIHRACKKQKIEQWSPNRLRHTSATMIRKRYGLEAAQVVCGHQNAEITQIYAERDLELARKVAREVG